MRIGPDKLYTVQALTGARKACLFGSWSGSSLVGIYPLPLTIITLSSQTKSLSRFPLTSHASFLSACELRMRNKGIVPILLNPPWRPVYLSFIYNITSASSFTPGDLVTTSFVLEEILADFFWHVCFPTCGSYGPIKRRPSKREGPRYCTRVNLVTESTNGKTALVTPLTILP